MRILLTNDDGINAEGLKVLEGIARQISDDVWICAPETEQSGMARALTLERPLRVREAGEKRFAVNGTPTDCVMLAVREIMKDGPPDLVLSGVNNGSNLCEDVTMSGTVAGATEAMALGIPAIALSQVEARYPTDDFFAPARHFGPDIVRKLIAAGWPRDVVMNVNFPSRKLEEINGFEVVRQGNWGKYIRLVERRTDLSGRDYFWIGYTMERVDAPEGTELRAIYDHKISIAPLHINLTHNPSVEALRKALAPAG